MSYEAEVAALYDLYCWPDRSPEADRWARLAGPAPACVLEPMSGTGEVALLLAEQGYTVWGVELSPHMHALAELRRQAAPPEVAARLRLVEGDISRVALPEACFDLTFVGSGSWNLLTDRALRVRALTAICRSLKPGGRLVLDLFLPLRTTGTTEPRTFKPVRPHPLGYEVEKSSFMERNAATQVLQIHETISVNGQTFPHDLTLQVLLPEQVEAELMSAGFHAVALYGGEDLSPYTAESDSLFVLATAP